MLPSPCKIYLGSSDHLQAQAMAARPGRPPLIVKSSQSALPMNRFLTPGASLSSSTSDCSTSAMAGTSEPHENHDPNVVVASHLSAMPTKNAPPAAPPKVPRGRPRKNPLPPSNDVSAIAAHPNPPSTRTLPQPASQLNEKAVTKGVKRKRSILKVPIDLEAKGRLANELNSELESLVKFYHEDQKLAMAGMTNGSRRVQVALLIEESSLPFSRLVMDVLQKLKTTDDGKEGELTLASLRSTVLSIGERISFGSPNPDADVLEDDSEACLWCWEVRDIKLLPDAQRSLIMCRRRKHRKIAERISALAGFITALMSNTSGDQDEASLMKAHDALMKTDAEDVIRAYINQCQLKKCAKDFKNEKKLMEKRALKEQHEQLAEQEKDRMRAIKEEEKKQKQIDKEEEKKKIQQEKERDRIEKEKERLEKEAIKQKMKEASRQEKELKRQQEGMEKEVKRREREEADLRKRNALQKQANIMDRFLNSKKGQDHPMPHLPEEIGTAPRHSGEVSMHEEIMHHMDQEMLNSQDVAIEYLLSSHVKAWKSHSRQKSSRWGQRRLPKLSPVKELRLQGCPSNTHEEAVGSLVEVQGATHGGCKRAHKDFEESEISEDKSEEWDESGLLDFNDMMEQYPTTNALKLLHFHNKRRKLLQFDKSHRPAYYGSYSKKSDTVRPRNPFKMDSTIEYENDSDEEWEEEDPGESLSDCEKDEEDEKQDLEEEEEVGDGFVVPDGYLSESEVADMDDNDSESDAEQSGGRNVPLKCMTDSIMQYNAHTTLFKFAKHRKLLERLTDQALRCNRPYIIHNLGRSNPLTALSKADPLCLEALRMCPCSQGTLIEVPQDPWDEEKVDALADNKPMKLKSKKFLPETALHEMVETMLSCKHGLKRLVDLLSTKFPTASRAQLKEKVRSISEFVENRWQVKKEILEQVGIMPASVQEKALPAANPPDALSKSPCIQLKPITKFFSKRCLPPEKAGFDTSPLKVKVNSCAKDDMVKGKGMSEGVGTVPPSANGSSIQSV